VIVAYFSLFEKLPSLERIMQSSYSKHVHAYVVTYFLGTRIHSLRKTNTPARKEQSGKRIGVVVTSTSGKKVNQKE
jgi:hypothetical protein